MTTAYRMVAGCQPYAPAIFAPRKYFWYSFLLGNESTPGPQCDWKDFMSTKNPLTPAGIEPATFRFVAQHLNHCAPAVPKNYTVTYKKQKNANGMLFPQNLQTKMNLCSVLCADTHLQQTAAPWYRHNLLQRQYNKLMYNVDMEGIINTIIW